MSRSPTVAAEQVNIEVWQYSNCVVDLQNKRTTGNLEVRLSTQLPVLQGELVLSARGGTMRATIVQNQTRSGVMIPPMGTVDISFSFDIHGEPAVSFGRELARGSTFALIEGTFKELLSPSPVRFTKSGTIAAGYVTVIGSDGTEKPPADEPPAAAPPADEPPDDDEDEEEPEPDPEIRYTYKGKIEKETHPSNITENTTFPVYVEEAWVLSSPKGAKVDVFMILKRKDNGRTQQDYESKSIDANGQNFSSSHLMGNMPSGTGFTNFVIELHLKDAPDTNQTWTLLYSAGFTTKGVAAEENGGGGSGGRSVRGTSPIPPIQLPPLPFGILPPFRSEEE